MSSGSSAPTKPDVAPAEDGLVRYSLTELRARKARGAVRTSEAAPEADLDNDAFWARTTVRMPAGKTSVHLRVDSDVLDWFKAQGAGHLTRMNAVLRAYVEAHDKADKI
ncbi:MAG: hypothetical protein JWN07_2535 [Hyphomicrobiales bacterium]|nr:hypothetical protein [Hyphomicrobiales bacterium]